MNAPVDNLVRAFVAPDAAAVRADAADGNGRTLYGHFAVLDTWTEISSMWEGNFLERIVPGAFDRTIAERGDQIKVLYDHGQDPQIGNKPLGSLTTLRGDGYYEVDLIRTSYNDDFVIPAAQAGLLGASFRFKVVRDSWVEPREASKRNPGKLPERSIEDVDLYELGPVTFPAYPKTSAGVRSMTDAFVDRLTHDPLFLARYVDRVGLRVAEPILAALVEPTENEPDPESGTPAAQRSDNDEQRPSAPASPPPSTKADRQKMIRQIEMTRKGIGKGPRG